MGPDLYLRRLCLSICRCGDMPAIVETAFDSTTRGRSRPCHRATSRRTRASRSVRPSTSKRATKRVVSPAARPGGAPGRLLTRKTAAARRVGRAAARRATRAHRVRAAERVAPRPVRAPRRRAQPRPAKVPQRDGGEPQRLAARAPAEAAGRAPEALAASRRADRARVERVQGVVAERAPAEGRAREEAGAERAPVAKGTSSMRRGACHHISGGAPLLFPRRCF